MHLLYALTQGISGNDQNICIQALTNSLNPHFFFSRGHNYWDICLILVHWGYGCSGNSAIQVFQVMHICLLCVTMHIIQLNGFFRTGCQVFRGHNYWDILPISRTLSSTVTKCGQMHLKLYTILEGDILCNIYIHLELCVVLQKQIYEVICNFSSNFQCCVGKQHHVTLFYLNFVNLDGFPKFFFCCLPRLIFQSEKWILSHLLVSKGPFPGLDCSCFHFVGKQKQASEDLLDKK